MINRELVRNSIMPIIMPVMQKSKIYNTDAYPYLVYDIHYTTMEYTKEQALLLDLKSNDPRLFDLILTNFMCESLTKPIAERPAIFIKALHYLQDWLDAEEYGRPIRAYNNKVVDEWSSTTYDDYFWTGKLAFEGPEDLISEIHNSILHEPCALVEKIDAYSECSFDITNPEFGNGFLYANFHGICPFYTSELFMKTFPQLTVHFCGYSNATGKFYRNSGSFAAFPFCYSVYIDHSPHNSVQIGSRSIGSHSVVFATLEDAFHFISQESGRPICCFADVDALNKEAHISTDGYSVAAYIFDIEIEN